MVDIDLNVVYIYLNDACECILNLSDIPLSGSILAQPNTLYP